MHWINIAVLGLLMIKILFKCKIDVLYIPSVYRLITIYIKLVGKYFLLSQSLVRKCFLLNNNLRTTITLRISTTEVLCTTKSIRTRSTTAVGHRHLKVKDKDISQTKNYCITNSIQKISSIHIFILKIQQILESHELKGYGNF